MQANKFNNRTQAMNAEKAVVDQDARRRAESLQAAQQAREALTRSLQQRVDKQEAQTAVTNRETGGDSIAFNVPNKFLRSTSDGTMKNTTRAGESEGSNSVTVSIREIVDEINNTLDANEKIQEINSLRPHEPISDQQEAVIRNMTVDQRDEFMGYFEPNASRVGAFNLSVYKTTGQILDQNVKRLDWQQKNGISTAENSAGWTMESELDFMHKAPDGAIITQDSAINGSSDLSSTFGSPLNGTQGTQVTLSELSQVSGNTSITAKIVNNEIVFSAPPDSTGKATFAYTIEDANGKLSTSYVDVEVSEYTNAELLERSYASTRIEAISNTTYEGLEITENSDGTYTFKLDAQGIDFTLAANALELPPTFTEDMALEAGVVGASQAAEQFYEGTQYFDLNDPEQKALFDMFIRVGASIDLHQDPYGNTAFTPRVGDENSIMNEAVVFSEMNELLFGTDEGKAWFQSNADAVVSNLNSLNETGDIAGNSASEVLKNLMSFLSASDPAMLTKSDGTVLSAEEKDIVMSTMFGQIGLLSFSQEQSGSQEATLNDYIGNLVDYAADIYAPDAAASLLPEVTGYEFEWDVSEAFNGHSLEEIQSAMQSGDYEQLGLTQEQAFSGFSNFLYTVATAGLNIRLGLEGKDAGHALVQSLGLFNNVSNDALPSESDIRAYVDAVMAEMKVRMDADGSGRINIMDHFYNSLDNVASQEKFKSFSTASQSIKSYSNIISGSTNPKLSNISSASAGFGAILIMGTGGLAGQGFATSDNAVERLSFAGWLTLLVQDSTVMVNEALGVTEVATDVSNATSGLNKLFNAQDVVAETVDGRTTFTGKVAGISSSLDNSFDNVGDLMSSKAVQSATSFKSYMGNLAGFSLGSVGTGLLSGAYAHMAIEATDKATKVAAGVMSGLWGVTSAAAGVSFAITTGQGIRQALGVTNSLGFGKKLATTAAKTAGFLARVAAIGFGIIGAIDNVKYQRQFNDLWAIVNQPGGPDAETGYYIDEGFRDLKPMTLGGAGVTGFLGGTFGFSPAVGFKHDNSFHGNSTGETSD